MPTQHDLFVSYADADRAWVEGYLLDALTAAGVDFHTEQAFALGKPRISEFDDAVHNSRKVLLVLSPAYMVDEDSSFVNLLAQHYGLETATWPVIPLILHPTTLPTRLSFLVPLDATDPDDRERVVERLCAELNAPAPAPAAVPPCPYPGMRPFTTEQAAAFYGRDAEIADAVDRLRRRPFLTVIGPSGSGKSSLVFAGIIPALQKSTLFGPGQWIVRSLRPGVTPLTELGRTVDLSAPVLAGTRLLLIIDQFEETFTLARGETAAFQQSLLKLMEVEDLFLVLTVRADFYPDLMASPLWEPIQKRRLEVTPLGEAQLREAIMRPAENVGVFVEAALVERLVADAAGEPGVLPLVQETLVLLWEKVERRYLPLRAYEALILPRGAYGGDGRTGLQVAISRRADDVYADLSEDGQAIARRIFLRLIQFGEGRADTRRQQTVEALRTTGDDPEIFDETLYMLTQNRLLTTSGDEKGSQRRVDISHEALIGGWYRLQEWLNLDREWLQLQEELRRLAMTWEESAREESHLPRWNTRLAMIYELSQHSEHARKLNVIEEAFFNAAVALREREATEKEQSRRSQQRRVIALVSSLALVAVLAIVAALITGQERRARSELRSRTFADEAIYQLDIDPEVSVLLASHALLHERYTYEAENALREALQESRIVRRIEHGVVSPRDAALSLDGGTFAVGDVFGKVYVGSSLSPEAVLTEFNLGVDASIWDMAFSVSGKLLGVVNGYGSVKVWNIQSGQEILHIQLDSEINGLAIHPDDNEIALQVKINEDLFEIQIWSLALNILTGRATVRKAYSSLTYSNDGQYLAIASLPDRVSLWDSRLQNEHVNWVVMADLGQGEEIRTIKFGSQHQLAVGSTQGKLNLWDLTDPGQPQLRFSEVDHSSGIYDVAISQDGQCVASVGRDHTARVWKINGDPIEILLGHTDEINAVAFVEPTSVKPPTPFCGEQLATVSGADGTVRIWNIGPSAEIRTVALHNDPIEAIDFSSDGLHLITASDDGSARIMTSDAFSEVAILSHTERINYAEFSQTGESVVTASNDGRAAIWQVAHPTDPVWLQPKAGRVFTAAFRPPSGAQVATGHENGEVVLWDRNSGKPLDVLLQGTGWINTIDFNKDGTQLVAGLAGTGLAYIVEIESNRITTLTLEVGTNIYDVAFGPDGESVYTLSSNGKVRLWRIQGRQNTYSYAEDSQVVQIHPGGAHSIAFDPTGRVLATGGRDGIIGVRNALSLQRNSLLTGNETVINDIVFSSDGRIIAAVTEDGQVRFYLESIHDLAIFAQEDRTTRLLTPAECQQFGINSDCGGDS
ncbi:MAG: TIR domain-containing protein [Caldilineaceae bacterium]|nr:TIR domain-containing protein [Caldilineaceae bacterium]MBP8108758.1 TIR domain-containing protein [Caldilineaceae bacterium]MBP8122331.1 TIR domain-containing protein [Caldilineaceae bacterium]MBP9072689.1 TIR domain-containing protein [Caldilineaceae bacterium]